MEETGDGCGCKDAQDSGQFAAAGVDIELAEQDEQGAVVHCTGSAAGDAPQTSPAVVHTAAAEHTVLKAVGQVLAADIAAAVRTNTDSRSKDWHVSVLGCCRDGS
ncbi:hypothetical protein OGATHE_003954 [Ogataea polymorpha]|uniref:Uncharacterized protein n=1 Tax=Ogataea polymorpha TaxID=460523 RepID=A0A9P8P512_9ASCO|nr:hypothetical protein OGATHE_003954 [Ogataea polymorpha]